MNRFTTSLATVAAFLAGGLIAIPTPAYAAKAAVKHAGVLHVYDGGSLFKSEGIERAKSAMSNTQFDHGLTLHIDTHSAIPAGKKAPTTKEERAKFFHDWANELAKNDKAKGIYVLVCRSPGYVQVIADKTTRDRGFSPHDEDKIRDIFADAFALGRINRPKRSSGCTTRHS